MGESMFARKKSNISSDSGTVQKSMFPKQRAWGTKHDTTDEPSPQLKGLEAIQAQREKRPSAVDILLHAQTVRLMQQYSGFSGKIRILKEKLQSWITKNGEPTVGSCAWEAKLEVEKVSRIIDERLDRLSRGDLDADAQTNLEVDIENLQQQLAQHQQTLKVMDSNAGMGFVVAEGKDKVKNTEPEKDSQSKKDATHQEHKQKMLESNHPGVELHNHLSGILAPDQLINLAHGGNYNDFLNYIWSLDGIKNNTRITRIFGDLIKDGQLDFSKATTEDIIDIANRLLTANEDVDFGLAYTLRGQLLSQISDKDAYLDAIVEQISQDNIYYLELQAESIKGVNLNSLREKCVQKGIQVRFLIDLSTNILRGGKGKRSVEDIKFGEEGIVGVDFAGPEKKFDPNKGMDNFQDVYRYLAAQAEKEDSFLVLRVHVGEGFHDRDKTTGKLQQNSQHRKDAEANLDMMIQTLEKLADNSEISDKVVVRFGHATHATPKQLQKMKQLQSKGVKIIVEANLSSNLATRSINPEEVDQVLLKFLYHDINTILNTDAGGVVGTNLSREYIVAEQIISDFQTGLSTLKIGSKEYRLEDLTPEQQKRFDIARLKQEADKYFTEVAPNIKDNIES
ncbi:MAG: hypothetical protein KME64_12240 [Scytonematopsis contorta HA4267-MV1]|jgi:hypothetical protein|nr:hypothetical protein [Scytonematopsis contorta HA4267-MV1]